MNDCGFSAGATILLRRLGPLPARWRLPLLYLLLSWFTGVLLRHPLVFLLLLLLQFLSFLVLLRELLLLLLLVLLIQLGVACTWRTGSRRRWKVARVDSCVRWSIGVVLRTRS